MKALKLGLLITAMLFMNACAYNMSVGSKETAAKGITYNYDKFKKMGWLETEVYQGGMSQPVTQYNYRAKYSQDSNTADFIQIYGKMFSQAGWCFVNSAYDDKGRKYKFHEIDRNVLSNSAMGVSYVVVHEHFAIDVPFERLEEFSSNDIEFKAVGKKCDTVFKVDHRVSAAFIDEIKNRSNKN